MDSLKHADMTLVSFFIFHAFKSCVFAVFIPAPQKSLTVCLKKRVIFSFCGMLKTRVRTFV